jgi:hypothetical protein
MNSEGLLGVLTWLDFAPYKWNQSWMDEFSSGLKGIEKHWFPEAWNVLSHPLFFPLLDRDICH